MFNFPTFLTADVLLQITSLSTMDRRRNSENADEMETTFFQQT